MKEKCCFKDPKVDKNISELQNFLKIVCDPNRLKIVCLLKKGERCVCEIFEALKLQQNLVSHHLAKLKQFGLVRERREGKFILYSLNKQTLKRYKLLFNRIIK